MSKGSKLSERLNNTDRAKLVASVLKFVLLLAIVVSVPVYLFVFKRDIILEFENFDDVVAFIESHGRESVLIYFALEILQLVISVLPGQVFQIAAGYIFGLVPGIIYTLIGAIAGTAITYWISYLLGRDAINLLIDPEKADYYIERLNSKRAYIIVFLLFLIPGVPKDTITYFAGASNIRFKPFLILSILGRMPAMIGSILIGYMYRSGNTLGAGGILVFAAVVFAVCVWKRRELSRFIDRFYDKISG